MLLLILGPDVAANERIGGALARGLSWPFHEAVVAHDPHDAMVREIARDVAHGRTRGSRVVVDWHIGALTRALAGRREQAHAHLAYLRASIDWYSVLVLPIEREDAPCDRAPLEMLRELGAYVGRAFLVEDEPYGLPVLVREMKVAARLLGDDDVLVAVGAA